MAHLRHHDTGPQFEERALAIARAIHDPLHLQGAVLVNDRERDGIFIDAQAVTVYEFTTSNKKEKAVYDAKKTASLLAHYASDKDHSLKALRGFLVTANEPTAQQRTAVQEIAKHIGHPIHIVSIATLNKQLIDAERYIEARRRAPFGSTPNVNPTEKSPRYIEPRLTTLGMDGQPDVSFDELLQATQDGQRSVLLADYGAGKSELLRQFFERLRKSYFKNTVENNIPLHLNLRDCFGLRTPVEILRRHGEDLAFPTPNQLISAWRSGQVHLLLDGFDELIPARWPGSATKLKAIRWQALASVRQLIADTPAGSGVIIAGRPQYFGASDEVLGVLGLSENDETLYLKDFDAAQAIDYLDDSLVTLPEWAPSRPLLLQLLQQSGYLNATDAEAMQGKAWLSLFQKISKREAERVDALDPGSVQDLMGRVATEARHGDDPTGPVGLDQLRRAFSETCGYEPDEQGIQLLLRLPGLISDSGHGEDARRFVDSALANAAYGHDLSRYILAPYAKHPLAAPASWPYASDVLTASVAAAIVDSAGVGVGVIDGAVEQRINQRSFDSILADVSATGAELGMDDLKAPIFLSEVLIPRVDLSANAFSSATFSSCVIEMLDASEVSEGDEIPTFRDCLIGRIAGWQNVPEWAKPYFDDATDIGTFESGAIPTVSSIVALEMPGRDRIAFTILKKVYAQAGAGRKVSALPRGLPLALRPSVPATLDSLTRLGWVRSESHKGQTIVLPVQEKRQEVLQLLQSPEPGTLGEL